MASGSPSGKPQFLLNTSTSSLVVMMREEKRPAMAKQTTWMVVTMIKGKERHSTERELLRHAQPTFVNSQSALGPLMAFRSSACCWWYRPSWFADVERIWCNEKQSILQKKLPDV